MPASVSYEVRAILPCEKMLSRGESRMFENAGPVGSSCRRTGEVAPQVGLKESLPHPWSFLATLCMICRVCYCSWVVDSLSSAGSNSAGHCAQNYPWHASVDPAQTRCDPEMERLKDSLTALGWRAPISPKAIVVENDSALTVSSGASGAEELWYEPCC